MSIELKIKLIEIGNVVAQVLQYIFILGILAVAWLEWRRGKKAEDVNQKELVRSFVIGVLTAVFFFVIGGFPSEEIGFWLLGAVGLVFGIGLAFVMKPAGLFNGKLRIKNFRVYAIIWLLTVFVGEILVSNIDYNGIGSPGSTLFGLGVLTMVTMVSVVRYRRAIRVR